MSKFFESDIVQEELNEINELQQEVYGDVALFGTLSSEDKKEHVDKLCDLLSKQRVMYTRLSLSDDPQARAMKTQLEKSVQLLGFPAGTDVSVLFNGMSQTIEKLKGHIDSQELICYNLNIQRIQFNPRYPNVF